MPTPEQKQKFINTLKGLTTMSGSPDHFDIDMLGSIAFYDKETGNFKDYSADSERWEKQPSHCLDQLDYRSQMDEGYYVVPSAEGPMAVGMDKDGETYVKDLDTVISELQPPKGNAFVRWFKRTLNRINDDWFMDDVMEEAIYQEKVAKLKSYKKKEDYKIDPEKQQKMAKAKSFNKSRNALEELSLSPDQFVVDMVNHIKTYEREKIMENQSLRTEYAKYMTVKVLTEGDPETIRGFLQGPLNYDKAQNYGVQMKLKDISVSFPKYDPEYKFNDPEATMKAIKNLNTIALSEPELSGLHVTAGICANILSDMVADSGMKLDEGQQKLLQINDNTLHTLGSMYVKALNSEMNMLSGRKSVADPETNHVDNSLSSNDVDKTNIFIKETVNTLLSDSRANIEHGIKNNLPLQILTDKNFSEGNIKTMVVNSDVYSKYKTVDSMEGFIVSNGELKKDATKEIVANGVKAFTSFKKTEQAKEKQKTEVKESVRKEEMEARKSAVTKYNPPTSGF